MEHYGKYGLVSVQSGRAGGFEGHILKKTVAIPNCIGDVKPHTRCSVATRCSPHRRRGFPCSWSFSLCDEALPANLCALKGQQTSMWGRTRLCALKLVGVARPMDAVCASRRRTAASSMYLSVGRAQRRVLSPACQPQMCGSRRVVAYLRRRQDKPIVWRR